MRRSRKIGAIFTAFFFGLALPFTGANLAVADVNDFSYDSWQVQYDLGVDAANRATAQVTEHYTPVFPEFDQNRGLVRGLPSDYEGTDTNLRIKGLTDLAGNTVPYTERSDSGFRVVEMGDDNYVHGKQDYILSYSMRDVLLHREDGTADEFYWDLLDTEHAQPIKSFTATINFSAELASKLNGNHSCYIGAANSATACQINQASDNSFTITANNLAPYQGITVAIGLQPNSVTQPLGRQNNFFVEKASALVGTAAVTTVLFGSIPLHREKRKRRNTGKAVIAQYDPPANIPVILAHRITEQSKVTDPTPAQIVQLAVKGIIRIHEEEKTGWLSTSSLRVELLAPEKATDQLEKEMLTALFGTAPAGSIRKIPRDSSSFVKKMVEQRSKSLRAAQDRGYLANEKFKPASSAGFTALIFGAVAIAYGVLALQVTEGALNAVAIGLGFIAVFSGYSLMKKHRFHTATGAEQREYINGVKEFIEVAEADRIKMLQSFSGAERVQVSDTSHVINIYEQLLPYAIIFGLEKEWASVLQSSYEAAGSYPTWFYAGAYHNISRLSSDVSSLTSSLRSATSYSSNSSGGSVGGGSVGGGGGGGFSGGR